MIAEGRRRHRGIPNLTFVEADATALPFADAEFDAVTMSFGLRNVNEPKKALARAAAGHQARRPPRRLRVLAPAVAAPSTGSTASTTTAILPVVAKTVSSNAEAYDYLNESIKDWPDQRDALGAGSARRGGRMSRTATSRSASSPCHRARKPAR